MGVIGRFAASRSLRYLVVLLYLALLHPLLGDPVADNEETTQMGKSIEPGTRIKAECYPPPEQHTPRRGDETSNSAQIQSARNDTGTDLPHEEETRGATASSICSSSQPQTTTNRQQASPQSQRRGNTRGTPRGHASTPNTHEREKGPNDTRIRQHNATPRRIEGRKGIWEERVERQEGTKGLEITITTILADYNAGDSARSRTLARNTMEDWKPGV
jgi:hypothetical protein